MKKIILSAMAGFLLLFGVVDVSQAQVSPMFNIPLMSCSEAFIVAEGLERNQFFQWYNGYLTSLYSAGKGNVAFALYFNPGILRGLCDDQPALPVWRLMEQAIAQVEAGQ